MQTTRNRRRRSTATVLAVAFISGSASVMAAPAHANGVADHALLLAQVGIVTVLVATVLGPVVGEAVSDIIAATSTTTDTNLDAAMTGEVLGTSFSTTLSGAGPLGAINLSGNGTYGFEPVTSFASILNLLGTTYLIDFSKFQVGSNTTILSMLGQSVVLSPGITSTLAATVDVDGSLTAFDIELTYSDITPGSIQATAVAKLGQDVVIELAQTGSSWEIAVSSVPDPQAVPALGLPALTVAVGLILAASAARLRRHTQRTPSRPGFLK